jgi:FMN phosphatase YigB (HAD superfamily)/uncharacterized coiled-coil protein SlyX
MSDTNSVFHPLVSVIIRSMDRATLQEALDSISTQTYSKIEVVLVNAKGVEHREMSEWCGCFPMRTVGSGEALLRSRAANVGLDAAHGEYLMFLDDDDWIEADHIEKLVAAIRQSPEFKVVYTGVKCVDEGKNPLTHKFDAPFDAVRMMADNFIPIHAVLFSRGMLELGCRFDESLDLYEDWDFWIQLLRYGNFLQIDGLSAVYRITQKSGFGVNADPVVAEPVRQALYKKWFNRLNDRQITDLVHTIRQNSINTSQIAGLHQAVAERDGQIASLNHAVAERDGQIASLNHAVTERDMRIVALDRAVTELDGRIASLNHVVAERDMQIASLNHVVAERDMQIADIYSSTSWQITKPLRLLSRLLRGKRPLVAGGLRPHLLHHGKRLYWYLPVQYRTHLLHWGYRNFGQLFNGMPHYEQWKGAGAYTGALPAGSNQMLLVDTLPQARHVEGRIAIHLHMYYHDLADEFSHYLKNMPFEYDLYVSVASEEGIGACRKLFSGLAKQGLLVIEQVPNRGRDIAPMFCTFGSRLKDYDYVAHLHSKKSLYNKGATEGWRQYLCGNLLGSEERIRRIFALMQGDEPRGIVYPQNYMLLPYQANTWLSNRAAGAAWCARLGISTVPHGYFDFPTGSMFWAKGNALKPLFDTGINLDDFAEESGQTDGTFAHCLERLLVLSSIKQGYSPGIIKDLQHPNWSAWGFQQYAARPFQSMVNQLANPAIKLIAFDIFDTLLCRPLLDAESIKAIVAERIGGSAGELYLQYRPIAEGQARGAAGKDIGMTGIFTCLGNLTGLSDETLMQLRNLEEEVEKASVGPRADVVELYRQSLATGKPVVLISDMFLPRAVIEESLQNNGVNGWSKLFLSNETGLRKDTGELYEHVFAHYGITPAEMLMVGDNERSDFQVPCDKGVVVMHVLKPVEFARGLPRFHTLIESNEGSGNLNRELTLGLVLRQNFSAISYPQLDPASLVHPTPFNIGYSLIGPLLAGLSQWLIESARSDGIDRLYFLAREGQLIKRVYDIWTEGLKDLPQADYLVLSRRAVSVPMIDSLEDILSIARATYFPNTIANFLFERYGLQLSAERWNQLSDQMKWSGSRTVEVYNQQIDHLVPLLNSLEAEIIANGAIEHDALKHYLGTMKLDEPGRQAVVDVGYGATIQGYLNRLVATPVHGYYMITDHKSAKVSQRHNVLIRGCYLENINLANTLPLMYQHSFELEKLLSSSDAQIVCYALDQDNNLTAHHRELSDEETGCSSFREELQEGVIHYARDAKRIRERILPSYKPSCTVATQLYEAFIAHPSQPEKDLLQKIALDDHYCGRGIVR